MAVAGVGVGLQLPDSDSREVLGWQLTVQERRSQLGGLQLRLPSQLSVWLSRPLPAASSAPLRPAL